MLLYKTYASKQASGETQVTIPTPLEEVVRVNVQGRGGEVHSRIEVPEELPRLDVEQVINLQLHVLLPQGLVVARYAPAEQLLILATIKADVIVTARDTYPIVLDICNYLRTQLTSV